MISEGGSNSTREIGVVKVAQSNPGKGDLHIRAANAVRINFQQICRIIETRGSISASREGAVFVAEERKRPRHERTEIQDFEADRIKIGDGITVA